MTAGRRSFLRSMAALVGAVFAPRFAHARPERVNIRDFGAVADGVADDTPAFERALAHAQARDIPTIYFPTGRYVINRPYAIGPDLKLAGE